MRRQHDGGQAKALAEESVWTTPSAAARHQGRACERAVLSVAEDLVAEAGREFSSNLMANAPVKSVNFEGIPSLEIYL
jgi:hypothetical protein